MIAFLPIPAGEDVLAGFPSSGLVALYKCDELTGNTLSDAMGYLPDLTPAAGVALDCATETQCIIDGTGLRALVSGAPALCAFGFEIITPALGTGATQVIFGAISASAANAPGIRITITQASGYGYADERWGLTVVGRMSVDGAPVAASTIALGTSDFDGLVAETAYQFYGSFICKAGVQPTMVLYYRRGVTGPWKVITKTAAGVPATSATFVEGATTVAYRLAAEGTLGTTNPFKGRLVTALFALGELDLNDVRDALLSVNKGEAQRLLPDSARYWQCGTGSGATVDEYITDVTAAITGTPVWSTALTTTTQLCLGQGHNGGGKWGIALGGEGSFAPAAKVATSTAMTAPIIQGNTGWTLVTALRVGDELPAAERTLVSLYGPLSDGSEETDATLLPGIHISYTAAGVITGRYKRRAITDVTAGTTITLGAGTRYSSNGVFTVYAISCDSTGAISARRMGFYDTEVTEAATAAANVANFLHRAVRVRIGDASLDCDLVAGPVAVYNRKLTDSEIEQIRNRCLGRMAGLPVYVDAAAAADGNGTERWPYAGLQSALRVHQPAGTIYLNGGAANQRIASDGVVSSSLTPASKAGLELIGTNDPVIVSDLGESDKYPLFLEENASGTWIFRNIIFDATDAGIAPVVGPPAYTGGATAGAAVILDGIQRLEMYGCTTKNAVKSAPSNGTGLTSRAIENVIVNHTSIDNEEHAAYFRIAASSSAVPHTFDIQGFTASGNGEDGIKCSNEFSDGSDDDPPTPASRPAVYWTDIVIDKVDIDGGKNQIALYGVDGGTVTNFLLTGADAIASGTGSLTLGIGSAYMYAAGVVLANGTIRDYTDTTQGYGVKVANATGCSATNIVTDGCFADLYDPTAALATSHCSGNSGHATLLWATGSNNQPDANMTFTGDAITADDGFEDGQNLWSLTTLLRTNLAAAARSETDPWTRGAY